MASSAADSAVDAVAESRTRRAAGAGRLLLAFAPNRRAGCLILGLCLVESLLLAAGPEPVYAISAATRVQVPLFVFLQWSHLVWLVWLVASVARRVGGQLPRVIRWLLWTPLSMTLAAALLLYVASWAMMLRTGRFANFESLRFLILNLEEPWLMLHIVENERRYVVGGIVLGVLSLAALPFMVGAIVRQREPLNTRIGVWCGRATVWLAVLGLLLVSLRWQIRDRSMDRRRIWAHAVRERVSPVMTLAFTALRYARSEPVEPVLSPHELQPIASGDWNPPPLPERPPSIIVLAIESLRHDVLYLQHQGREVMPNLNRLARGGVHFTRAYTQSTHSDYADVCLVSSLYPLRSISHHYYRPDDPWPKTLIYDLLKPAGYATAIISSQNEKWGGMDNFLSTPNLDWYYDAERSSHPTRLDARDSGFAHEIKSGALRGGTLDDDYTTDQALTWIADRTRRNEPFFLSMNFQSSHFPYAIPDECERPFQPCVIDFDASFTWYPPEKAHVVRHAYYNALLECDRQIGRLVESLADGGLLDETIFVVAGENGEAFHENGIVSHAGKPAEPVVHVALVVHCPRRIAPRVEEYPTELIDLPPTLLGLLGWPRHPGWQGVDVLDGANRPPLDRRSLYFHTENPLARTDGLLFAGRWKLIHDRDTGLVELFDLHSDPGESKNLRDTEHALAATLEETLKLWRSRQLAYYHYPHYYLRFYPPAPPRLGQPRASGRE